MAVKKTTTTHAKAVGGMTTASTSAQMGRAAGKTMASAWLCHEASGNGPLSGRRKRVLYVFTAKEQAPPSMTRFRPMTTSRPKSGDDLGNDRKLLTNAETSSVMEASEQRSPQRLATRKSGGKLRRKPQAGP